MRLHSVESLPFVVLVAPSSGLPVVGQAFDVAERTRIVSRVEEAAKEVVNMPKLYDALQKVVKSYEKVPAAYKAGSVVWGTGNAWTEIQKFEEIALGRHPETGFTGFSPAVVSAQGLPLFVIATDVSSRHKSLPTLYGHEAHAANLFDAIDEWWKVAVKQNLAEDSFRKTLESSDILDALNDDLVARHEDVLTEHEKSILRSLQNGIRTASSRLNAVYIVRERLMMNALGRLQEHLAPEDDDHPVVRQAATVLREVGKNANVGREVTSQVDSCIVDILKTLGVEWKSGRLTHVTPANSTETIASMIERCYDDVADVLEKQAQSTLAALSKALKKKGFVAEDHRDVARYAWRTAVYNELSKRVNGVHSGSRIVKGIKDCLAIKNINIQRAADKADVVSAFDLTKVSRDTWIRILQTKGISTIFTKGAGLDTYARDEGSPAFMVKQTGEKFQALYTTDGQKFTIPTVRSAAAYFASKA